MLLPPLIFASPLLAELLPGVRWGWGVTGVAVAGGLAGYYWWLLRRQRRELRRSEARFRRFFEEATVAIVEQDFSEVQRRLEALRDHGVRDLRAHLAANAGLGAALFQCVKMTAANRRALALMDAIDLTDYNARVRRHTHAAPPGSFVEELVALWEGRDEVMIETTFPGGDDRLRQCIVQWRLSREQGRPNLRQVLVVFTDLTELRSSEERHRRLFEGAAEGVYESLPSGVFRSANPALARILGYESPRQLLAQPAATLDRLYARPGRRREFYTQLETDGWVRDFESEIIRPDDVRVWITENASVVRAADGKVEYLQGFVTDITARKHAEQALRESEARWRLALQASAAGIWENNLESGQNFYSDRSKEMLGFAPDELSDNRKVWVTRIHPDDVAVGRQAMLDHLSGRVPHYQVEHRFRCKDGSYKWILSRGRAELDAQGRVRRIVGTHVDINERKLAEQQLRASEARYRTLFEHSPIGIMECDDTEVVAWLGGLRTAGVTDLARYLREHPEEVDYPMRRVRLTGANAAAKRLVGAADFDDLQAHLARNITLDATQFRRRILLGLWSGRNEIEGELGLVALDGSLRRVHAHWWVPVMDGELQYHRTQLAMVDLTEMKSAEQALSNERERLSVTLSAMAEGVVTVDNDGLVRYVNDSACALTGWEPDRVAGRPLAAVCRLQQERTGAAVPPPDAAARTSGQVVALPPQTVLVRADGVRRLVEGRCAPMHDHAGHAIGAVLVMHDVTDQSRLEAELQRASKLESVGLLAGGIAHDFNNILAIIMGNLNLAMMEKAVEEGKAARWLKEAERGAMRARDLTQQLLTFAKGGEPVRASVQLAALVREAAEFALHGAAVRSEFDLESGLWPAEVDKGQIGQVVQNLVINAVQAMPKSGVLSLVLRNEAVAGGSALPLVPGRYLRLSVHDTGPGMDSELLSHIFEPYFTTKESGVGLGLATVYSIVKKHRGHISVESSRGTGTVFHLWLPAAEEPAAPTARSQSPFDRMGGKVLFMDDEQPIRQMAAVLLERLGFEPVLVEDGAEAVREFDEARAAGRPFDLVVMDLTVPGGLGGLESLKRMREIDPAVKAIVSSGYSSDPVMADYRAHGFSGMVAKPYRISDLAKTLREVLNGGPAV